MVLNSEDTEKLFQEQFKLFRQKHDLLKDYAHLNKTAFNEILPRELRIFRIRLQLVIGLKIGFDTEYSMVKSKLTFDTYVEIMKCNEAWFAYEGLKKFSEYQKWNRHKIKTPIDLFEQSMIDFLEIDKIQDLCNKQLNNKISKTESFKIDVISYLEFLSNNLSHRVTILTEIIKGTIDAFNQEEVALTHIQILAIIYGTRNIFVHKGESAKFGVKNYNNKIALLRFLYDFMILFQLKFMNYAIMNQIELYNIED